MRQEEVSAVLWAAVGYAAGKEGSRQDLSDGTNYTVDLKIAGQIEGKPIETRRLTGKLQVGCEQVKASSAGPKAAEVLAAVLGLIGPRKRAEVLRTLPEVYAAAGNALDVDPVIVEAADGLLARLRVKIEQKSRGPVSLCYQLQ